MPWKCPACSTQIRHNETELIPRPNVVYRCHVCHLELILDPNGEELTVAPLPAEEPPSSE
jgi:hypothetical protein